MKLKTVFGIFLILYLAVSCSGKKDQPAPVFDGEGEIPGPAGPAWPALALLRISGNPLWFELGSQGPVLIESPETASLAPFVPWPHARFVTGMQLWNEFLVMAINRDGFLILEEGEGEPEEGDAEAGNAAAFLYRVSDSGFWDPYTAESFFFWDNRPAVLLYRNDFFTEPVADSPMPQVYVLDKFSYLPLGVSIPALESFPPGGAWEAELIRRGPDGLWYYRMREKEQDQNDTAYFRTGDLAAEGERISIGEWIDSSRPESPENSPPLLGVIIDTVAELGLGQIRAIEALSPEFEGRRLFGSVLSAAENEKDELLYAYCREIPVPLALVLFPDGRLFCSGSKSPEPRQFSLPALPEGFAYTGIALLGNVLAVSWEEQEEAGIGAAGFMVMSLADELQ